MRPPQRFVGISFKPFLTLFKAVASYRTPHKIFFFYELNFIKIYNVALHKHNRRINATATIKGDV